MRNAGKTILVYLFIFFLCFYPIIAEEYEYSEEESTGLNDWARITDVDYKATLVDEPGEGSKLLVTERLTFDVHAASKSNPFWELWRDLPEDNSEGVPVEYDVISVKQIMPDGTKKVWEESPQLYWEDYDYVSSNTLLGPGKWFHSPGPYNEYSRDYECVFFYIDGVYREEMVFELTYEMSNPALRYLDCSELYLTLFSEESVNYLESFNAEILIPNKDMPSEENYIATTFGTVNESFPFEESKSKNPGYHTFSFSLDEDDLKFRPYNEFIEFDLVSTGPDKHIFTENAPNNWYSNDYVLEELDEEREYYQNIKEEYKEKKTIVFTVVALIATFALWRAFSTDTRLRNKYTFYEPEIPFEYFREIPRDLDPLFAANFAFCKDVKHKELKDGYSALMLSLLRKEYIEISKVDGFRDWTPDNTLITVKHKPLKNNLVNEILKSTPALHRLNINPISVLDDGIPEVIKSNENSNLFGSDNVIDIVEEEKIPVLQREPLTYNEELYFNLLVRHSNGVPITMKSFQSKIYSDFTNTDKFVEKVDASTINIGTTEGYFQRANYNQINNRVKSSSITYLIFGILFAIIPNLIIYPTRLDLAFGAFFILGLAFIINSIHLKKISKKYTLLTQLGENEYTKWRGLYEFLNSETLMNERTIVELPLWEKYLVYATAFGISEKVIKALKIRCPEIQDSPMLSNSHYRSNNFYSSNRSFRRSVRSASHYSRSYSSGGSWGYGGGGRGGGGGRRRSLITLNNKKGMNLKFIPFLLYVLFYKKIFRLNIIKIYF